MKYFIYYSATGNGDFLASLYKEAGYEIVKVETEKPFGKVGFFKILKFGGRAMQNKREKIKPINVQINEDDLVVIGSPVWNDRLSTPINSVIDALPLNKETTKFVLYPAGQTTNKSLVQLNKLGFKEEPLVISNPLKNQEKAKEIIK